MVITTTEKGMDYYMIKIWYITQIIFKKYVKMKNLSYMSYISHISHGYIAMAQRGFWTIQTEPAT